MTAAARREPADGSGAGFGAARIGAIDGLCLAAAPAFAIMALLTGVLDSPADILCSATQHGPRLSGMVPMYLLMSAFHLPPWLRLLSSLRRRAMRRTLPVEADQSLATS
ncbi:MAG: hypothetical protein ACRCVA_34810 [Phreatobacter sp.]